jgi:hypothetical protein
MYRSCIFCSADLGSNDSIGHFPVGRSLAFDGAKGRLWAVCPKCARWNLAPLEERWEAIEDAERLFRDARTRVHSEKVGLARLRDGTRLVRVGAALPGELAVWRYGSLLARRRVRYVAAGGAALVAGTAVVAVGGIAGLGIVGGQVLFELASSARRWVAGRRTFVRLTAAETGDGLPAIIRQGAVQGARLNTTEDGILRLCVDGLYRVAPRSAAESVRLMPATLILHGDSARRVLARAVVRVNAAGASRRTLQGAVDSLARAGSPGEYVMRTAAEGFVLGGRYHTPAENLALEMALHEETERRALEGELAALEEMWRQAEEIAAIADRLPDELPAAAARRG